VIDSAGEGGEAGQFTVVWMDGDKNDTTKALSEIAIPLVSTSPALWASSVRVGSQVKGHRGDKWAACKVASVTQGAQDGSGAGWVFDLEVVGEVTVLSGLGPRDVMVTLDSFKGDEAS